ncbi:MAG: flagellar hook-length control protein FliK [Alphaproteobacteria bacterium]|nr:flagellar hook-length control protein FliK [Alphaproteobacteria bacterium]
MSPINLPSLRTAVAGSPMAATLQARPAELLNALALALIDGATATAPADEMAQSAAAIVRDAVARQGGLSPLYADLEAVVQSAKAPPQVLNAARQLLALRVDVKPDGTVAAGAVKAAVLGSGALSEAAGDLLRLSGTPTLRMALQSLRDALTTWIGKEPDAKASPESPKLSAQPEAASGAAGLIPSYRSSPTAAQAPAIPPGLDGASLREALTSGLKSEPATKIGIEPPKLSAQPEAAPRAPGLMPPYRSSPTVAQPPVLSSIPGGASPRELAHHLLDETDAALARDTLLQIASLPEGRPAGKDSAQINSDRLTFDIPLSTVQGTAVAQIRIEHDDEGRDGAHAEPVWRAVFSIDIEPIGPVHVRIALAGNRTSVSMKAERAESADRLSRELPMLEAGLRSAKLDPGKLLCQQGEPLRTPAPPGQFVDHAT